jgi:UrcA family protein
MNTVTCVPASSRVKPAALAFGLLALCTLVSTVSFADPGATHKVTERGTVSLAGLDVLTPEGLRIANWRIQQMAQSLCLRIANMDERDAATCVGRAVADAHEKLDAVIQARLAERSVHTVASKSKE